MKLNRFLIINVSIGVFLKISKRSFQSKIALLYSFIYYFIIQETEFVAKILQVNEISKQKISFTL